MRGPDGPKNREAMIRGMFTPATPPPLQDHVLKMMLAAPEATAYGAMVATFDPKIWTNDVMTMPVLGLFADKSALGNPDATRKLFPNYEHHEIPGTGHFLMMEKPREFNALLTAFVDTLPRTPASTPRPARTDRTAPGHAPPRQRGERGRRRRGASRAAPTSSTPRTRPRGALGPVTPDDVRARSRRRVAGRRPVTAALGDARDAGLARNRTPGSFAAAGRLAGQGGVRRRRQSSPGAAASPRQPCAAPASGHACGAAWCSSPTPMRRPQCVSPATLLEVASSAGAAGVLLDTADKSGPRLTELVSPAWLTDWVALAHRRSLLVALAGRLASRRPADRAPLWRRRRGREGRRVRGRTGGRIECRARARPAPRLRGRVEMVAQP